MDAYTTALTLLSRRELSASQLRDRLTRRKFDRHAIDAALDRLTGDHTLDDRRVAVACARTEAAIKGRGRRRVLHAIQRLGIGADIAEDAVAEVFADVDETALLQRAIEKRLKGASLRELHERGKARIIRHLVALGFAPSRVLQALRD